MDRLAEILREAGLTVIVGQYSLRLRECSHFSFQEYGGDLGAPRIEADAESTSDMLRDAERVSHALSQAETVHRFEVYDEQETLAGYFHHGWPK